MLEELQGFLSQKLIVNNDLAADILKLGVQEVADFKYITHHDIVLLSKGSVILERKLTELFQQHVPQRPGAVGVQDGGIVKIEATPAASQGVHCQQYASIHSMHDTHINFVARHPEHTPIAHATAVEEPDIDEAFKLNRTNHGGPRQSLCTVPIGKKVVPFRMEPATNFNFTDEKGAALGGWLPPSVYSILRQNPNGLSKDLYDLCICHIGQWVGAPAFCVASEILFDPVCREYTNLLQTVCHVTVVQMQQMGWKPTTNLKRRVAGFRHANPRCASKLWCVDLPAEYQQSPYFPEQYCQAVKDSLTNPNDGVRKQTVETLVSHGLMKRPEEEQVVARIASSESLVTMPVAPVVSTPHPKAPAAQATAKPATQNAKRRRLQRTTDEEAEEEGEEEADEEEEEEEKGLYANLYDASDDDGVKEAQEEESREKEYEEELLRRQKREEMRQQEDGQAAAAEQEDDDQQPTAAQFVEPPTGARDTLDTSELQQPLKHPVSRHAPACNEPQLQATQLPHAVPAMPLPRTQTSKRSGGARGPRGGSAKPAKAKAEPVGAVADKEAGSLHAACAIVAAKPAERTLKLAPKPANYMNDFASGLGPLLRQEYRKPLSTWLQQVRKWEASAQPEEGKSLTTKQAALSHMVGQLWSIITSTVIPADKKRQVAASTVYSKDLCYIVSAAPNGAALNVLWLVQHPLTELHRIICADLHWGTGASGIKLDVFSPERGGRQLSESEMVKVAPGVFFALEEGLPKCLQELNEFDANLHESALKEAKKLGAQKRKAAQQKQDEEDEAGFQQRLEKDYDRCAPGEVNILEPGAKRGCRSQVNCAEVQHQPHTKESPAATEQQQLRQPDIHQWALQRAAKIEEMKKRQRQNPKHWRSREDLEDADSSYEEGGGNQAAAKKEKKQAAAKSVAEEHDVAGGDDLASDVASDAPSQDL
jgi:hypothetical protein